MDFCYSWIHYYGMQLYLLLLLMLSWLYNVHTEISVFLCVVCMSSILHVSAHNYQRIFRSAPPSVRRSFWIPKNACFPPLSYVDRKMKWAICVYIHAGACMYVCIYREQIRMHAPCTNTHACTHPCNPAREQAFMCLSWCKIEMHSMNWWVGGGEG